MNSLGGSSFFVDQTGCRLGVREPLYDVAKNLERWVDGIVLRTFSHQTVTTMAQHASIPVINALSDHEHPCQALADMMCLHERFGDLKNVKLAYVGDGNNVAHSLMLAAAQTGCSIAVATPEGFQPSADVANLACAIASETGATIEITHDAAAAVKNANAVYTDVWASMGQEDEADERRAIFAGYQVNPRLFSFAAKNAVFMHCLPAHRGDEVTASVIDAPNSVVFDQAENRLHVQKAVLAYLMSSVAQKFAPKRATA
jgi:ornithine carbamoyltransferase